jgi:glycosyltransferase involved in cell wall biosynthesis
VSAKKIILQVCKVYFPVKGGVQIVVERLAKQMQDQYSSTILTTAESKSGVEKAGFGEIIRCKSHFELFSMPFAPSLFARFFSQAAKADVILSHSPFPLADIAILLSFFRINKLIVYWHSDVVTQKLFRMLLSPITHLILRKSDAIVVSNPVLIQSSPYLSKYREKCSVVPIGFEPDPDAVKNVKDMGYFLFVGRHVPYKGIGVLIDAANRSGVKLVLIGNGPLFRKHQQKVEKLGISDKVTFVKEADDYQVQMMMSECKALVLPSVLESEAFGMVQVEAMAFGKPIINTNLESGVPWVARNGIEAMTVEPNDVKALSKALHEINVDSDLGARLGENAVQRWKQEFTLSKMVESLDRRINSLN